MTPGNVVGDRFEIDSAVATGGSSRVYRARDQLLGGWVALKVLFGPQEVVERFSQEVEILTSVRHPVTSHCPVSIPAWCD